MHPQIKIRELTKQIKAENEWLKYSLPKLPRQLSYNHISLKEAHLQYVMHELATFKWPIRLK